MFSISTNDDDLLAKQQSASGGSYISSKNSALSDIYERSDEGSLEKKLDSSNNVSSGNITGSQSR
jgi:hypothetical protein